MASLELPSFTNLRQVLRTRRRPIAAVLAGCAVLLALISLQPAPPAREPIVDPSRPMAGEVAIAIELASQAAAALLLPGDHVDIVEGGESHDPRIIARDARVLTASGSSFLASSSSILLIAVDEGTAMRLAGATGDLTPLLQARTATVREAGTPAS